jgi:myosin V
VRNDNSSRFGRFTQLQFHHHTHQQRRRSGGGSGSGSGKDALVGSECVTYLLEKSRVVHHSKGERTYHVFYQLLAAPEEDRAQVGLGGKGVGDFRYLACDHGGSETTVIEGRSDAERYKATRRALGLIGVQEEQQREVLATLAGILYLGEIDFVGEEGAGDEEARVKDEGVLAEAARLLGCDATALATAMCSRTVKTRHESYAVPMTPAQAVDAREALSKEVYARLFAWLVARINGSTAVDVGGLEGGAESLRRIGLLDIFGFESFAVNRFEQLCINYCNGACLFTVSFWRI